MYQRHFEVHMFLIAVFLSHCSMSAFVSLQGPKFVRKHDSVIINCSTDSSPVGQAAEILVNSQTYTNIRVHGYNCFSGILEGKCSQNKCNCSYNGKWFTHQYQVHQDDLYLNVTCIMKFEPETTMSDTIKIRIIDINGPHLETDSNVPFIAGSVVKFTCRIETMITKVDISWDCLGKNIEDQDFSMSQSDKSVIYRTIQSYDEDKNCTCVTHVDGFITSSSVRIQVEKMPILESEDIMFCNSSDSVNISCLLSGELSDYGFDTWIHLYNGVIIRKLKGVNNRKGSYVVLRSCSFQDAGVYVCTAWNQYTDGFRRVNKSISLVVNSRPVAYITKSYHRSSLNITANIYSTSGISSIVWLSGNKRINNSSASIQILEKAKIEVTFYDRTTTYDGYIATLKMQNINSGKYFLLIENGYGTSRELIEVKTERVVFKHFDLREMVYGLIAVVVFVLTLSVTILLMRRNYFTCSRYAIAGLNSSTPTSVYFAAPYQEPERNIYDSPIPEYLELPALDSERRSSKTDHTNESISQSQVISYGSSPVYEEIV